MKKTAVLASALILISCGGCADKPALSGGKVLAKINNYELTVEDFNDETRLTAANKGLRADTKKAREEMLDEVVSKKILLQEAQRQNFDKDRAFMNEIERYWEQALIKLMVRRKTEEFARAIIVGENEVREEYARLAEEAPAKIGPFEEMAPGIKDDIYRMKMRRMFNEWLALIRGAADVKIYKENL